MRYGVTIWRTLREPPAPPPMNDLEFSPYVTSDLEEAHDHSVDAIDALESLQCTDLWPQLPLETRRALSAAHAHLAALADTLATVV
jgi:hypothetical protein